MTTTTLRRAALAGILAATVAAGCASPVDSAAPTTTTTEESGDWQPAPRRTTTTPAPTTTSTTVPPTTTTVPPTTTTTVAPAPPADLGPDLERDVFLMVVHSETDSFDAAPDDLIVQAAQAACTDLDAGVPLMVVMADGAVGFGATTEAEYADVGFLVGAGVSAFCPQHQGQVTALG